MTHHPDRPYRVSLRLRIDWSEMDMFLHVNNVMFMKYVQSARVNYWEQCGMAAYYPSEQLGPMLLSSSCHFKKPLFYPGHVVIKSRLEYIKQTSFSLHHVLENEEGEEVASATDIMVWYDFKAGKKEKISDEIRHSVSALEQFDFTLPQS